MSLGRNLQYLRQLRGNMTQETLAEKLNVSRQTVSKWEMDAANPEMDKAMEHKKTAGKIKNLMATKQILLVGPLRAGKTQIRHSYADDTVVIPTNGRKQSEKAKLMFFSKKRLLEIGGGSQEMTDYPFICNLS